MTWDLNLGQQAILLTIRGRTSPTSLLAPVSSTGKEEGGVQEEIQHSQSIHGKWLAVGGDVYARERQQARETSASQRTQIKSMLGTWRDSRCLYMQTCQHQTGEASPHGSFDQKAYFF